MTLTVRLAFFLSLASVPSFAAHWSGALVDSECYATAQKNVSFEHPGSTNTRRPIRSCSPNEKTKSFAIVQVNGMAISLDSDGNEKARAFVLKEGKKSPFMINVVGEMSQDALKVDTISMK
jgi:hypothetical protein